MTTTKDMIRTAVLELCLEKSINDVTVSDILAKVSIARSTFYTYYSNPHDILTEIGNDILAETKRLCDKMVATAPVGTHRIPPSFVVANFEYISYLGQQRETLNILQSSFGDPLFQLKRMSQAEAFSKTIIEHLDIRENKEMICDFITKSRRFIVRNWMMNYTDLDVDTVVEMILELIWRPLFNQH